MDGPKKPGQPAASDDAWASLDDSDDWRDRSVVDGGHHADSHDRPVRTATNVRISPREGGGALRATNGPHLVVVAGAEVGRIYPLPGTQLTVGRGEGNDVLLTDASVSREHARLELRQGTWWVVDLQSANGTFIQARRVQSGALASGEQVAFGHVRLQLRQARLQAPESGPRLPPPPRVEGAPAAARGARPPRPAAAGHAPPAPAPALASASASAVAPAEAPAASAAAVATGPDGPPGAGKGRRRLPPGRAVAAALVLALVGGGAYVYRARSRAGQRFAACQAGAKAFAAHDLDAAEQAFAKAAALAPSDARARAWRQALHAARTEGELLRRAEQALAAGSLGEARALWTRAADGVLRERSEALVQALVRAEQAVVMEAQAALGAGLQQEAAASLARLGPDARPDVAALQRWLQLRDATGVLRAQAERYHARPHRKPSLWEQADGQSPALRRALATFRRARAAGAARAALRALGHGSGAKEQQFAAAMQRFAGLWEAGVEEYRGKRAFAAIRVFTEAKQLAASLGGEATAPARDINLKLADMYYVVGMQALASSKLPEAAEALRVAQELVPNHALSGRRLQEIEDRATRMLDQAEFIREGHAARAKDLLRQVSATMPNTTPAGQRARALLKQLP